MISQLLKEGFILKSKGCYKHAAEAFYKALEIDDKSEELLLEIADLYRLMGNEERALNYIEQVLDKNPAHVDSLKLLKDIFIQKGAYAQAEQTAKNIYLISKSPDNLAEIFKLLNKQGKFQEIFEYKTGDETPEILYEKAFAKFSQNSVGEAEILINKALDESKNNKYLLLKGKIFLRLNRDSECEDLSGQFEVTKDNPEVLDFMGIVEQKRGNYKKALEYFMAGINLSPQNDEYYYHCASTCFKMNEIALAKKFYNHAINLNPGNENYHFALANLYYSEKQYKRALEELSGDLFEARLLKSIILYDTGYLALARKELEELLKIQPDNEIAIGYINRIKEALEIK